MKAKVVFIYRYGGYYGQKHAVITGEDHKDFQNNLKAYKKEMSKTYKVVDYIVEQEIL